MRGAADIINLAGKLMRGKLRHLTADLVDPRAQLRSHFDHVPCDAHCPNSLPC